MNGRCPETGVTGRDTHGLDCEGREEGRGRNERKARLAGSLLLQGEAGHVAVPPCTPFITMAVSFRTIAAVAAPPQTRVSRAKQRPRVLLPRRVQQVSRTRHRLSPRSTRQIERPGSCRTRQSWTFPSRPTPAPRVVGATPCRRCMFPHQRGSKSEAEAAV